MGRARVQGEPSREQPHAQPELRRLGLVGVASVYVPEGSCVVVSQLQKQVNTLGDPRLVLGRVGVTARAATALVHALEIFSLSEGGAAMRAGGGFPVAFLVDPRERAVQLAVGAM